MADTTPHQPSSTRSILTWRQRAGLAALGCAVALVVVEGGLRLGGWLLLERQHGLNPAGRSDPGTVSILCLGESTTALGGRDAYPRQLERLLERARPGTDFAVVNEGIAATTTTRILARLPELLERHRPDVVVAMMGVNDHRFFAERDADGEEPWWQRLARSLRVGKLIRFCTEQLARHLGVRTPAPPPPGTDGRGAGLGGLFVAAAERAAREGITPRTALTELLNQMEGELAAAPDDHRTRGELAMAWATAGRLDRARALIEQAPEGARVGVAARAWVAERLLDQAGRNERRDARDAARAQLEAARALVPEAQAELLRQRITTALQGLAAAPATLDLTRPSSAGQFPPVTGENYRQMAELLAARGVPLVAVQYPLWPVEPLAAMLEGQAGIVLVENRANFIGQLAGADYAELFDDRFAGDFGHMTPRGAGVLAAGVAETLLARVLPPRPTASPGSIAQHAAQSDSRRHQAATHGGLSAAAGGP